MIQSLVDLSKLSYKALPLWSFGHSHRTHHDPHILWIPTDCVLASLPADRANPLTLDTPLRTVLSSLHP